MNVVEKSSVARLIDKISLKLFNKKAYEDQILTYYKGSLGQIVIPWHKKVVIFEFYDDKKLVKRIEKEVVLDPKVSQYSWNLSALYEENDEWCGKYLIEVLTDEEILKGVETKETTFESGGE